MDLSNYEILSDYPESVSLVDSSRLFYERMRTRRTIRHFDSRPVDRKAIEYAIRTAGTAPSGANHQPWFFVAVESGDVKRRIREAAEKVERDFYSGGAPPDWLRDLKPLGTDACKAYLEEAPFLILIFSRVRQPGPEGEKKSHYPIESTGLATGLLIAALHSAGLATLTHTPRPMGFLNGIAGLDSSFRPYLIVVTGHPRRPVQVPRLGRKTLDEIALFL